MVVMVSALGLPLGSSAALRAGLLTRTCRSTVGLPAVLRRLVAAVGAVVGPAVCRAGCGGRCARPLVGSSWDEPAVAASWLCNFSRRLLRKFVKAGSQFGQSYHSDHPAMFPRVLEEVLVPSWSSMEPGWWSSSPGACVTRNSQWRGGVGENVPVSPLLNAGVVALVPCSPVTTIRGNPQVGVESGSWLAAVSCQQPYGPLRVCGKRHFGREIRSGILYVLRHDVVMWLGRVLLWLVCIGGFTGVVVARALLQSRRGRVARAGYVFWPRAGAGGCLGDGVGGGLWL